MADDVAGAVRRTPRPARDELIDRTLIRRAIADPGAVVAARWPEETGPAWSARAVEQALIDAGWQKRPVVLLCAEDCACPVGGDCPHGPEPVDALDLAVWLHAELKWQLELEEEHTRDVAAHRSDIAAERDAILPRLADLAEASGKARTAEWLRTCAGLPMSEWPPAPAYKGAVVHLDDPRADFAAMTGPQLRDLRLRIVNELRQRPGLPAEEPSAVDERDALQARIAELERERDGDVDIIGSLQLRIDDALALLEDAPGMELTRVGVEPLRAALQGDQPTEPRHELILTSGLSGVTGVCSCGTWRGGGRHELPSRVAHRWDAEHLTSLPLEQPAESKTPSGFSYRQHPHDLCGSNVERQQVGDPGHCEDCCSVGHVVAHPDLGCGDVGCYRTHGDEPTGEAAQCRCGARPGTTHVRNCAQRCQDCGGDPDGPARCRCRDDAGNPVCTCTENRCDYDDHDNPLTGDECIPCGQCPEGTPCLAIDEPTGEADRG